VWRAELANGVRVIGTRFDQVPMTRLSLCVPAGRLQEPAGRRGLASLTAEMLEEGTRRMSGTELVEALDGLGAQLTVVAGDEDIALRLSVLDACLDEGLTLLSELVLEPRFAATDFERVKRARAVEIDTRTDRAGELADEGFARLVHGPGHPRGESRLGTRASIEATTLEDVRTYWARHARARGARLALVGAFDEASAVARFRTLAERWQSGAAPETAPPAARARRPGLRLHLVDKPGAAQSELRLGHLGPASTDPDYYPLQALNYLLGGAFSSRLNLNLREDKGYTYGIHSRFEGGRTPGAFEVSCAVASNATAPALAEIVAELRGLARGIRPEEAEYVRRSLSRALSRSLESTAARLHWLEALERYGHPLDLLERRLAWLKTTDAAQLDDLARRHIHADALEVFVVGDRAAVLEPLLGLGWGEVLELDAQGERLQPASA
jgi:zinc protease